MNARSLMEGSASRGMPDKPNEVPKARRSAAAPTSDIKMILI